MFHCDQCGLCCKAVGSSEIYQHLDRGDGICIHFNLDTNLCNIYENRPLICRVDDAYEEFFKTKITMDEYYRINYRSCEILKERENTRVSDIKDALINKFEEIFGYTPGDDYAPRVKNARDIICQGKYKKEDMIDITDTSLSSNGKAGLVLTIDSVCVKDAANSTSKFIAKYEDIDYTYMNEDRFLGVDITALELNMKYDKTYRISIDAINKAKLIEFIDYAISLYQEDEELVW
ncbi:YkgJ family cysteine cluster protein [Bacillus sp. JJ1773]|uniref:YkgJ family cysteine cluster protein n=1 Tax=Bacillus sp. JJ1773 TaxID=3122965 RepID=UPI002FFE3E5F